MKYIIAGTGPAGVIAAETLRKVDPGAGILLIGDEPEPPDPDGLPGAGAAG